MEQSKVKQRLASLESEKTLLAFLPGTGAMLALLGVAAIVFGGFSAPAIAATVCFAVGGGAAMVYFGNSQLKKLNSEYIELIPQMSSKEPADLASEKIIQPPSVGISPSNLPISDRASRGR